MQETPPRPGLPRSSHHTVGSGVLTPPPGEAPHPVPEGWNAGCPDAPGLLGPPVRVPEVVEEASPAAEQPRNDVELELVQQSRCQVLPGHLAAAPEHDVLPAGGLPCLLERGLD